MGKNEKVIGLMKDELGGQVKKLVGLSAKTYNYLKDNNGKDKKLKRKKCVSQNKLKFKDYKKCLKASQIENIRNYLEKKEIDVGCLKKR